MPKRAAAPTEPTDEELVGSEQEKGMTSEPVIEGAEKPITQMSSQEILALLEKRRSELSQLNSVAKEKGIEIPKKSKPKVADADRLMQFFNRLGYSAGMRWWAQSRLDANVERISPVIDMLGEGWDPEKHGEAVSAMAKGFREARMQTSFPSTSMPDKKVAEDVPEAEVWVELQEKLRMGDLPEFVRELLDADGEAEDEPVEELEGDVDADEE
jgi:hypothetical protein